VIRCFLIFSGAGFGNRAAVILNLSPEQDLEIVPRLFHFLSSSFNDENISIF